MFHRELWSKCRANGTGRQGGCLARDRRGGVARFGEELEGVVAPAAPRGHLTPCVGSAGVRGRWGTPTLSLPTPRNASLLHRFEVFESQFAHKAVDLVPNPNKNTVSTVEH